MCLAKRVFKANNIKIDEQPFTVQGKTNLASDYAVPIRYFSNCVVDIRAEGKYGLTPIYEICCALYGRPIEQ